MLDSIELDGEDVTLYSIRKDCYAAIKKGMNRQFAFTPSTVLALLDAIEERNLMLKEIRKIASGD